MNESKHDEREPSLASPSTPVTISPALAAQTNAATTAQGAQASPTATAPSAVQTEPATTVPAVPVPPSFDQRLIHIVEKSQKPLDITEVQQPDSTLTRILEQK